ncbi:MAG TPA: hypothetical protein VK973_04385 [Arenicellales bacterium]|nr:hypothetical protein [Arenicellales bacterium]
MIVVKAHDYRLYNRRRLDAGQTMSMPPPDRDWRRWLRRKIGWLLLFKVAALAVLWMLFFSPAQRIEVDDGVILERLAPGSRSGASTTIPGNREAGSRDV